MKDQDKDLISILYEDYYNRSDFSKQTSSHWKKFGLTQRVSKSNNVFKLEGVGFGDYKPKNILNSFKSIPTRIYLSNLLKNCDKNIINSIHFVANQSSRIFSYDLARQALILNKLNQSITELDTKTFCIIGDGYGSLGCLIKSFFPKSRIIQINLGRTLIFDLYYSQKVVPESEHFLIRSNENIFSKHFNYIEAEKCIDIEINADIFINVCSMQEMKLDDVISYFKIIRKQSSETYFYCCNRISKELPDKSIINFSEYGWLDNDMIIFDELCPWHQEFPINRPPFISNFDGPIQHRLIKVYLEN